MASWVCAQVAPFFESRGFVVLAYCLMPDHMHLLLEGLDETANVIEAMRLWKQRTGFGWKRRTGTQLWQKGFYDRVLRDTDDTRAVVRYVLENPIRAGLVRSVPDYPWVGSSRCVFPIFVPPLRERPEDIAPLVHHFVRKFSREIGREIDTISATTMDALQKWPWPGNIRELENVIERAVILTSGATLQVPASAFQGQPTARTAPASAAAAPSPEIPYREGERDMILKALREAKGVIAGPGGAAARLGLKRTTLHSKMRKLGIERPSF